VLNQQTSIRCVILYALLLTTTVLLPDFTAASDETSGTKWFWLQILEPTLSKYVSRDNWM